MSSYPYYRPRRLRKNQTIRNLVKETHLNLDKLIYPFFVMEGKNIKNEINSMPNIYQFSIDTLLMEMQEIVDLGLKTIILFGIPDKKDEVGSEAYSKEGIVQKAIRAIKQEFPDLYIIGDVCLCEYTSHGHCGLIKDGEILNDETLELLALTALSQAEAGVDMVAPSDMMDGRVQAIREKLDENGYSHIPIMSYAAKYASSYYGPFRDAAGSAPQFGDRKSYQMDPANREEALREVALDIEEGADLIIVKPALAYLDIVREVKNSFSYPVVCYNVSGEYAMIKAAAQNGWVDEKKIVMETLTGMHRAGADIIITYHAKDVAKWFQEG